MSGTDREKRQPLQEGNGAAWMQIKQVNDLPEEGYRLTIGKNNVLIEAATSRGAKSGVYAVSWLWQKPRRLPIGWVEDWPDFPVRGFMLDISRGKVPTGKELYSLLIVLAGLKYNHIQLYTEHTFAFREHKIVWAEASPLETKSLEEFQLWCDRFGIELSANFNSFGHFERWLKHPEYQHLAECPEGFEHPIKGKVPHGTTLRPNAASLKFLDKLWGEYLPLFKSKRFNLGGDEPWELGQGWSKPLVKKYGKHRVYLDFLKKLHKLAKKHGKEMLFWGDILLESPELVKEVPKDATALLWGYEADHPFAEQCAKLAAAKRKFWVCPGTSAWNTFTGRTDNMLANIESAAKHGLANGAEGFLLTSWGDGGNHQPWPLMYPGLVYAAGMAWNAKETKRADLVKAVNQVVFEGKGLALAKALITAGKIEAPLNKGLHNATRLHRWFFASANEIENESKKFSSEILAMVAIKLRKLALRLAKKAREPRENYYGRQELKLGLDMAAWAARRGQLIHQGKGTRRLKIELNKLIKRFEQIWLLHAQPGGLQEAVARMRAVEKER
jgi:hexosaminidase